MRVGIEWRLLLHRFQRGQLERDESLTWCVYCCGSMTSKSTSTANALQVNASLQSDEPRATWLSERVTTAIGVVAVIVVVTSR